MDLAYFEAQNQKVLRLKEILGIELFNPGSSHQDREINWMPITQLINNKAKTEDQTWVRHL